jgi:hypothetical protein
VWGPAALARFIDLGDTQVFYLPPATLIRKYDPSPNNLKPLAEDYVENKKQNR